jgi:enoyl-CoA hydratase/carnithine racemase
MFRLDLSAGIARLTLSRPEARNAIPLQGWAELSALIDEVDRSDARALVLAGEGGAFSAGADLGDFQSLHEDPDRRVLLRRSMRSVMDRLRRLSIPCLAAIEGPCFGAGVALAMACDLRLAAPSATFAITPAKLGISYPQEDVERLVSLVGPGQAARLLLAAQPIDAREAARIGLVEIVAGEGLGSSIDSLARAIVANSAESLVTLKQALVLAERGVASGEAQDRRFDDLFGTRDFTARLAASGKGRRPPLPEPAASPRNES